MLNLRKILILPVGLIAVLLLSVFSVQQYELLANQGNTWQYILNPARTISSYHSHFAAAPVSDTQLDSVINQVKPSVVSIYGVSRVRASQSVVLPFFNVSFSLPDKVGTTVETTAGTGFFIDSRGYILTNKHVVSGTNANYVVNLSDGTEAPATVIYRDPTLDLAIVKIEGANFPTLALGDSSQLKVGQQVVSMGNAFGKFGDLPSSGTVTGLHENILASDNDSQNQAISDVFETNAQLYPGDSGGPTFESNGSVVGINVAMAANVDHVSFVIPINYAKSIINKILAS